MLWPPWYLTSPPCSSCTTAPPEVLSMAVTPESYMVPGTAACSPYLAVPGSHHCSWCSKGDEAGKALSGQAQKMVTLLWLTKCLERHTWQIYCPQNLPQRARVFQRPEWGVWPTLLHQAVVSAMFVLCLHVQAHMYTPMHVEVAFTCPAVHNLILGCVTCSLGVCVQA